ncbi:MAG: hypothetical protein AAFN16_27945 [Pseudomonadota bacterium]
MNDEPTETLQLGDLPDPDDYEAVKLFARSFNGYSHFGSFKRASEEAKAKRRVTLVDLRNELFMAYRTGNHTGDHKITLKVYSVLHPHFQRLLEDT